MAVKTTKETKTATEPKAAKKTATKPKAAKKITKPAQPESVFISNLLHHIACLK